MFWQSVLSAAVRAEGGFDLSTRQMTLLLTLYVTDGPHSVKSLNEQLGISKPAICRAVDVLCQYELIKRKRDPDDKRLSYLQRTIKGSVFLTDFAEMIAERRHHLAPMERAQEELATA